MKTKLQNSVFKLGAILRKRKIDFPTLLDRSIRPIGSCSFVIGIGAAAMGMRPASDYLLAAGVLCYLVSWFGDWWKSR